MKILFVASEAVPYIKSGGLADVAGALSKAVRHRRNTCRVVLPLYSTMDEEVRKTLKYVTSFYVPLGWRHQYCGVFEATTGGVKYYFLDNEYYFGRRGLYGFFDDAERFAFFSKAVLEMLPHIGFTPDVIHCNDWQTALVPVYLNVFYRHLKQYTAIKTVFTIHNIQYQGKYDLGVRYDVAGLNGSSASILEFEKCTNYMKGGIEQCDALTTVSPTYAHEILDPWYSHGLHGILSANAHKLTGILNGLDTTLYDPEKDDHILENYTAANPVGKAANKQDLQLTLGLEPDENAMVIGMVTRLVEHKGLDLVQGVLDQVLSMPVQLVLLGSGDWKYEKFFRDAAMTHPRKVSVTVGFDDALARKIYSGADVFLMPSKSEPCGLSQMIALRYGTIPVVRATGGLADSITDFGAGEGGNGYDFLTYNAHDMLGALQRACGDFSNRETWDSHVDTALRCDFSWGNSAREYIALYNSLVK